MIDANTQALEDHLNKQDMREQAIAGYGNLAYNMTLERILEERREDVVDIIMDDPASWLKGDNANLVLAMEQGDPREMGRAVENIMEEAAQKLIDMDDVYDLAYEIATEGGL